MLRNYCFTKLYSFVEFLLALALIARPFDSLRGLRKHPETKFTRRSRISLNLSPSKIAKCFQQFSMKSPTRNANKNSDKPNSHSRCVTKFKEGG